ncbi:hypothetical protein Q5752_003927 [Cryptotrichosporon argae]
MSQSHRAVPHPLDIGASTPLANQVAGHQNVLTDASGALVIKPALPREIAFYQLVQNAPLSSPLAKLQTFLAEFYGTLQLEGRLDGAGQLWAESDKARRELDESIVLENVAHPFLHPSILDAKLGTTLYAADASDEKKARMDEKARQTTSHATGLRLTGAQTYHALTSSFMLTPRSFGYSLTKETLPSGMVRFFPLPADTVASLALPSSPAPSTGSSTGAHHPFPSATVDLASAPSPASFNPSASAPEKSSNPAQPPLLAAPSYTDHAIPPDDLLRVLDILLAHLDALAALLRQLEIRFIGASLLVVYEGDPNRLADALRRFEARQIRLAARSIGSPVLGEGEDDEDDWDGASDTSSESETRTDSEAEDTEDAKDEARARRRCPPLVLKMIDFAHTTLAHGEGPDEGVLLGIQTLRGLVQGRRREVEVYIQETGAVRPS